MLLDRLDGDVEVALRELLAGPHADLHRQRGGHERLAGLQDAVEVRDQPLLGELGHHFGDRPPDHVIAAEKAAALLVRDLVDVRRTAEGADQRRRALEQLGESRTLATQRARRPPRSRPGDAAAR